MKQKAKLSDYSTQSLNASTIPRFYIGQEVKTEHGIGIIVELVMPHNGLYIEPKRVRAVVWYGVQKAVQQGGKWITFTYRLSEISAI